LGHSRENFEKFLATGGKGKFHGFKSPTTGTGHQVDKLGDLWSEILEAYLAELGLPFAVIAQAEWK